MRIPRRFEPFVLIVGTHEDFTWFVTRNTMGYRCGYVIVPPGHPWFGLGYADIDADAHGGLTFAEATGFNGWCVGFDCAHDGDAPDPTLPAAHIPSLLFDLGGEVRSQEYVEAECLRLCQQAAAARCMQS